MDKKERRYSLLNDKTVDYLINSGDLSDEYKIIVDQWKFHADGLEELRNNTKILKDRVASMEAILQKSHGVVCGIEWVLKSLFESKKLGLIPNKKSVDLGEDSNDKVASK